MACVMLWNIVYYDGCCDTCDSKHVKSPVMCAYACAREGGDCRFFYSSKNSVFDGGLIDSFFCIRMLFENNTSLLIKRHVVFTKTIRCFHQNDTLFLPKRYVVFAKTSRRFHQNDTLFYNNRLVVCVKTTGRLMSMKLQFRVGSCRMNMN